MGNTFRKISPFVVLAAVVVMAACAGGPAEDPLAQTWTAVQDAKSALDAKRAELATLVEQAAAEPVEVEGEEAAEPVDYSTQIAALTQEVTTQSEAFATQLVEFLNADPMIEGEPISERQKAAIRFKSSEDMVLAKEWIDQGGDYKKALDIYRQALALDPDNADVQAALTSAEEMRYMSEERFAAAKKGMTDGDIRAMLGTPLHYNVRSYEENGVTAWFYPTGEDGAAAGVWFRPDGDAVLKVYQVKYTAVEGKEEA